MNKKNFVILIIIIFIFSLLIYFIKAKDQLLVFLLGTMILDYFLGIYIAAVKKKSKNAKHGTLNSIVGYSGLLKKVGILVMVWIGYEIDISFKIAMCRNMVIIGYLINEIISINENLTILGVKKNKAIKKVIDLLEGFIDDGNTTT